MLKGILKGGKRKEAGVATAGKLTRVQNRKTGESAEKWKYRYSLNLPHILESDVNLHITEMEIGKGDISDQARKIYVCTVVEVENQLVC